MSGRTPGDEVATRAARNTAVRAAADLAGKLASLATFVVLAREEGPVGVGVLVFSLAWNELALAPLSLGFDRYMLLRVARDRSELDRRFFNVIAMKLALAVPLIAGSFVLIVLVGDDSTTRTCVFVLAGAMLLDGLSLTLYAAFNALERAELIATSLVFQRLIAAGLAVTFLLTGGGVISVAVALAVGSAVGFAIALTLMGRRVGMPARVFPREPRRDLRRQGLPFAAQDLMSTGVARIDAVLLSALATQAIVGYYGAAYRLLEATVFLSVALQGAFSAMFAYLDARSEPTIQAVVQRALKFSLGVLTPCAIVLGVLAEPILELLYGDGFDAAVTPLRLLALTVVPLGIAMLVWSLITSRREPRVLVVYAALTLVVNIVLNLALIPSLEATGAALAMLGTYLLGSIVMIALAVQTVGPLEPGPTLGAPLLAGAAMTAVALPLQGSLALALPVAAAVYAGVFLAAERRIAPGDFEFLRGLLRLRRA